MDNPPKSYCPLCHSPALAIVYGKSCRALPSSNLPENACFGGCIAFPDENGRLPDRLCPACGHEWMAFCQSP